MRISHILFVLSILDLLGCGSASTKPATPAPQETVAEWWERWEATHSRDDPCTIAANMIGVICNPGESRDSCAARSEIARRALQNECDDQRAPQEQGTPKPSLVTPQTEFDPPKKPCDPSPSGTSVVIPQTNFDGPATTSTPASPSFPPALYDLCAKLVLDPETRISKEDRGKCAEILQKSKSKDNGDIWDIWPQEPGP